MNTFSWADFDYYITKARDANLNSVANFLELLQTRLQSTVIPKINSALSETDEIEYLCKYPDSTRPFLINSILTIAEDEQENLELIKSAIFPEEEK